MYYFLPYHYRNHDVANIVESKDLIHCFILTVLCYVVHIVLVYWRLPYSINEHEYCFEPTQIHFDGKKVPLGMYYRNAMLALIPTLLQELALVQLVLKTIIKKAILL